MLKKDLIGNWQILSLTHRTVEGGKLTTPYGKHPSGFLHYLADGRMSVAIQSEDRKNFISYFGSYKCKEDHIIHQIDISSRSDWNDATKKRFGRLDGDVLVLTTPEFMNDELGAVETSEIRWRRIP